MTALARLVKVSREYEAGLSEEKRALVRVLRRSRLASPAEVARLHETLLYLRAFPDDPALLREVERALIAFPRRRDLARFRGRLADSGIAGTEIRYRFFWPMAQWLASRWPERLRYATYALPRFEERLRGALPVLTGALEAEAIRRNDLSGAWIVRRMSRGGTDAAYVVGRIARLPAAETVRESIHDAIDATYVLAPGPGGPSRTLASYPVGPVVFRRSPPRRDRPDLLSALSRPPRSVRRVGIAEGRKLVDLAREAMVTRSRDLDAFAWGNPRDVRIVEEDDGLDFALIGVVPERRLPLPAVHGWLTLRNGVPTGYVQSDTLLASAEIAFNTFETYRGTDAAHVFARVLAVSRHVLGARSFSIEPYQLGLGNEEGLLSGAWWFYTRLGFRPKDAAVKHLYRSELAKMKRRPAHRSPRAVLEKLAAAHLYWGETASAPALLPRVPQLGLRLASEEEAMGRLGLGSLRGWSAAERSALRSLAPVLAALPARAGRRALLAVVRGKADPDEDRSLDAWRKVRGLPALLR